MDRDQVLDFIKRRWSQDANWCSGNCGWFALILTTRFPELSIYYLPIEGHFVAGAQNMYFDWTGAVQTKETPILFEEIFDKDSLWASHLIRDCFK